MDSKFDYRDPGTDPAYCDGLTAEEESLNVWYPSSETDEFDGPTCIYCDGPIATIDDYEPYCSALCACYADRDNLEDSE